MVYTGIRLLLLISSFISFFFLSHLQLLKFFVTLFSGTVRPGRLILGTHMDSGQMYRVYRNQAAAAYLSLYFIFLSLPSSIIKIFVTLFSGTVRPGRLILGTHMDSVQMYRVYRNQAAASYLSFYFFIFLSLQFQMLKFFVTFSETVKPARLILSTPVDSGRMHSFISSFFFLPNFQALKIFVTLFSGIVKPRRLKLDTHLDSGQMYRVYRNQAAAAYLSFYSVYSSLYFFIFLSLQFSNIKMFRHTFLRNCEA